jgi:YVTN family beta-propeller protein
MQLKDSLKNPDLETVGKDSLSSTIYVINGGGNTVSAIRSSDDTVISTIEVGGTPITLAAMADGAKVYAGVFNKGAVVIQTGDNAVKTTIKTKPGVWECPQTIAITPDGSKVYVIDTQLIDNVKGTITVIQTSDDEVHSTFQIDLLSYYGTDEEEGPPSGSGIPPKMVFIPDGTKVYITVPSLPSLSVYRTSDNTRITTLSVGESAQQPVITPDGSKLYVASEPAAKGGPILSVVNTATDAIVSTVPLPKPPAGMVITPDGSKLYVAHEPAAKGELPILSIIDTATDAIVGSIPLPDLPADLIITPDGSRIYAANPNKGSVSVIQTADHAVLTVMVGDHPAALFVTLDGSKVYVSNQNSSTVSAIQTSDNTVVATVEVGGSPQILAGIHQPKGGVA